MINFHPLQITKSAIKYLIQKNRKFQTKRILGLNNKNRFFYPYNTCKSSRKYSIISAVYRVEKYLDEMLSSLLLQTLDFKSSIQVILVDDGSDDGSTQICKEWASRYPDNIIYLHKENGGQASARNYGLAYATGDWVTFIDPDDLLDKNYFLEVDKALNITSNESNLHIISCNFIYYYEDKYYLSNSHPLRYRFNQGQRRVNFDEHSNDIQLSVSSAFFNHKNLLEAGTKFINVKPNAEDMHFVAKYLLNFSNPEVLFVPESKYWYRKRADNTSALDTSWSHKGQYSDVLKDACLDLLNTLGKGTKTTPRWLQRTILYHLIKVLDRKSVV